MPISLTEILTYPDVAKGSEAGDKAWDAFGKTNANMAVIAGAIEDAEIKAFVIPVTAEDGVVEAGAGLVKLRMPYAFVLTDVRASLNVEETGGDIKIDIFENGFSVLNFESTTENYLVIPSGTRTSVGATPQLELYDTILGDDSEIEIDVVEVPSGAVAAGLKVTLIGYAIGVTY